MGLPPNHAPTGWLYTIYLPGHVHPSYIRRHRLHAHACLTGLRSTITRDTEPKGLGGFLPAPWRGIRASVTAGGHPSHHTLSTSRARRILPAAGRCSGAERSRTTHHHPKLWLPGRAWQPPSVGCRGGWSIAYLPALGMQPEPSNPSPCGRLQCGCVCVCVCVCLPSPSFPELSVLSPTRNPKASNKQKHGQRQRRRVGSFAGRRQALTNVAG